MLLIGERYRERLKAGLDRAGQAVLWIPDNPSLDPRLAGHADLSVFVPDDQKVIVGEALYPYFVKLLTNMDANYTVIASERQGRTYPQDAGLCVCRAGKHIIYNHKTVDPNAEKCLYGVRISVPQGYSKCSVCIVADDAIITPDNAIAQRASEHGIDVLKISPGHIVLDGYPYGFIGGAAFLMDEHSLALTGTLENHPDEERILTFLRKYAVNPVYLTDEPIFDIGSAVCLP